MFQSLFFIAACLIGPALAIEAVLNFDFRYTLLITGALGTIYTALGGMKGVIWTDVFQFFVLYGTVLTIIILGVSNSGGMAEILRISGEDGRLNAFSFDFSPTKRLSFFSTTIGASFAFSPGFVSQTAVQRYMSVPSLKHSQMTILASMPFFYIYLCILYLAGLVISVYYDNGLTSLQLAINATLPTGFPNSLLRGAADANYEPNFKSPDQVSTIGVSSFSAVSAFYSQKTP
ncbi:sodium-dependent multivitamin transporter-like [Ptychodera flava]|uniref:sodium-dependent multivitamin transporter-like n=1 Tax=Ptychodera flava TaxID=63121 RepID=UPI00396A2C0C